MKRWFSRLYRRPEPEPEFPELRAICEPTPRANPEQPVFREPARLTRYEPEPDRLKRLYPELIDVDYELATEPANDISEDEIATALDLLRGGMVNRRNPNYRATKPARFHLALRHVDGFAQNCLLLHPEGRVRGVEMYAGYLVWAQDQQQQPVPQSDFDYALTEFMAGKGGMRGAAGYTGCRFRPDFARRLQELRGAEVKRRLGAGLEGLMTGGE
jgi:hypothetical protein